MAATNPQNPNEKPDITFIASPTESYPTFHIHKSLVCPQSGWFEAKANETNSAGIFQLTEDSGLDQHTIRRMLWYLYHGDYSFATMYPSTPDLTIDPQHMHLVPEWSTEDLDLAMVNRKLGEILLAHVRVFKAAKYFNIPALKSLSADKFEARLRMWAHVRMHYFFDDLRQSITEIYEILDPWRDEGNMEEFVAPLMEVCLLNAYDLARDQDLNNFIAVDLSKTKALAWFVTHLLGEALNVAHEKQTRVDELEGRPEKWEGRAVLTEKSRDQFVEGRRRMEELERRLYPMDFGPKEDEDWEDVQMEG